MALPRTFSLLDHIMAVLFVWRKCYGVTMQMKPLQQYFHMVLFV